MAIVWTILILGCCALLLYSLIKSSTKDRSIIYVSDRDKALVYNEGDIKIIGRPDYIKREENNYVPYEYKSLEIKSKNAYLDHRLQLACYMRLIEKNFGQRPDYGIITYGNNKTFRISNTLELQQKLDKRISRLKELKAGRVEPVRNHNIFEKCFACKYYSICKHRLEKKRR